MEEPRLPGSVSPGPFPAKLWRLANSPRCGSIFWDARGERLLIDQRLLQRELLGARPGGGGAEGAAGLFKTKNFASFVRQLNLYGFRKAGPGPAGSAAGPVGGDGGSPAGPLHHFQSPHFRRARPDLLLHVQRLTGADKAKLAAGLQGSSRPPTGCQQRLGTALPSALLLQPARLLQSKRPGQFHQPYPGGRFFPYSYAATSPQNHGALRTRLFTGAPVPGRTWQDPLGLFPWQKASPAFAAPGVAFPLRQRASTEVTYTVRPVTSILPLHQWPRSAPASLPESSSRASPTRRWAACCPTALNSVPAHPDPLPGCAAAASTSAPCSSVQSPSVQSPSAAELPPSHGPCETSVENEKIEVRLEDVFWAVDEVEPAAPAEPVEAAPVQSPDWSPQSDRGQALVVNGESSDTAPARKESQLECVPPVAPESAFVPGADRAVTCSPLLPSELLCATAAYGESVADDLLPGAFAVGADHAVTCSPLDPLQFLCAPPAAVALESAAAGTAQESVTAQEALEKLGQPPEEFPSPSSEAFVWGGLFHAEQENTTIGCTSSTLEAEERHFPTEPASRSGEDSDGPGKPGFGKRSHGSDDSESPGADRRGKRVRRA